MLGDLGLGFIPLCEKGPQWGRIQTLSVLPALLSGRRMERPPWAQTAAPCSWAGRVGSCGILHLQQTSRVDGCRAGGAATLQEHTAPFMEPGTAKVMAGGHRGAGQAWAQSLLCPGSSQPTRVHMHKHTALRKPKIHSQQPPTYLHTYASTHLHPPGHSPVYLLPGRETHTCGTRPAPPNCPPDPLGCPAPPMPKAWSHPSSPYH